MVDRFYSEIGASKSRAASSVVDVSATESIKKAQSQTPHNYKITRATQCSASGAFNRLAAPGMTAPGAPAAQEGFTRQITLTGNNPISQNVDSSSGTITNTTSPTHEFYPGTVVIQVDPSGGGSVITITGTGTSSDPLFNDAVGLLFFGSVADGVAWLCSPSAGIPMP